MEFKTDCKIAGYPGLAHIVVQKYDDNFSVWYGCINVLYGKDGIQSTDEFGEKFLGKTLQMEIEDGRSVPIQVVSCQSEITHIPHKGKSPSTYLGCYFMSQGKTPEEFVRRQHLSARGSPKK